MTANLLNHTTAKHCDDSHRRRLLPGLLVTTAGVAASMVAHRFVSQVGGLTWAVILGAFIANANLLPEIARPGLRFAMKKFLRVGVVLLGFSLSLVSIASLGLPVIVVVVVTLLSTLLATTWLGLRLGLGRPRSLLIGTGFAICGASVIAAMEENAEADDDDVAVAITMVTICGTIAMIVLPLLQGPLGPTDTQFGAWAGASVHEVGQVVAAASPAGATAVSIAIVVKLTRVLLLAPVIAGVSVMRRRRSEASGTEGHDGKLPPIVPMFVLGFLVCVVIRSVGFVPDSTLGLIGYLQTIALSAALFAMGTGVHLPSVVRSSGSALATVSTLVVACVSLAGVLLIV